MYEQYAQAMHIGCILVEHVFLAKILSHAEPPAGSQLEIKP
jgi:hypothetical protein